MKYIQDSDLSDMMRFEIPFSSFYRMEMYWRSIADDQIVLEYEHQGEVNAQFVL